MIWVGLLLTQPQPALAAEMRAAPPEGEVVVHAIPPFPEGWVIREGLYAVVGGDSRDKRTVDRLSAHAEEAVPRIANELGLPAGSRMRVYIAHTAEQFEKLQPGSPPRWADGTAWPHEALVFLKAPRLRPGTATSLEKVLDHETIHVVLGQSFGSRSVPRWLQEGLTQVLGKEYTPELTRRIARGMLGNRLLTLDDLTAGFPDDPIRAQLAYAESADLIAFLENEYGKESVQVLIQELAAGLSVRASFRGATGQGLDEIDQAWRARLARSNLWISALSDGKLWWGIGAVLLFAGGLAARRRRKRRLAVWEREEALRESFVRMAQSPPAGVLSPSQPGRVPPEMLVH
jgi:hypothetical protein